MCLVEVEKSRNLFRRALVTQGMQVYTDSKIAKDAQEGVMEFLLINHPLDCPICDQGESVSYKTCLSVMGDRIRVSRKKKGSFFINR